MIFKITDYFANSNLLLSSYSEFLTCYYNSQLQSFHLVLCIISVSLLIFFIWSCFFTKCGFLFFFEPTYNSCFEIVNCLPSVPSFLYFLKKICLFIFREQGREGEREGEKRQCVVASWVPAAEDLTCNPSMCPHWEWNWQLFGSQARTQSTELHQPGHFFF